MSEFPKNLLYHVGYDYFFVRRIVYGDLQVIAPEQYFKHINRRLAEIHTVSSPEERGLVIQLLESSYRFSLGAIGGGK